jgi:hypothetical protein
MMDIPTRRDRAGSANACRQDDAKVLRGATHSIDRLYHKRLGSFVRPGQRAISSWLPASSVLIQVRANTSKIQASFRMPVPEFTQVTGLARKSHRQCHTAILEKRRVIDGGPGVRRLQLRSRVKNR